MHEVQDNDMRVYMMNISSDPLLTGKITHHFKDGNNLLGKPHGDVIPDINISGLGVAPRHNQIKFDEGSKTLKLVPNDDPNINKTYLNGELITGEVPLKHGDWVLFGNNQLYIIVVPPDEIDKSLLDYEDAMKQILDD